MRPHRFIGNFNLDKSVIRIDDPGFINQIKTVLRLSLGKEIILADGHSGEAMGIIKDLNKNFAEVEIRVRYKNENESAKRLSLYCAVLKKENFELVVQKTTEIGVKKIIPMITGRTVKLNLKMDRLDKIAKEAAEQSGRGIVPEISQSVLFEDAIKSVEQGNPNIFLDPSGSPISSLLAADSVFLELPTVNLWIGPEGGWLENEIDIARVNKFKIISLGKTILRAETAAIVSCHEVINL